MCALPTTRSQAQCELSTVVPDDAGGGDGYGWSVAIDGCTIIAGSPFDDDGCPRRGTDCDSGSAYVHQLIAGEWVTLEKLEVSDNVREDQLGWSVALDGDTAIVGAPDKDVTGSEAVGVAFVFVRDDNNTPDDPADDRWTEQAVLHGSSTMELSRFGTSVDIAGDTALVGAPGQSRAYVYHRENGIWSETDILIAWDSMGRSSFGHSVAIEGDVLVVGAPLESREGISAGAAYVYRRSAEIWFTNQKLIAPDAEQDDQLGIAVALQEAEIVVGSLNGGAEYVHSGAAYVYHETGSTWSTPVKLVPEGGLFADEFGASLVIDGDLILIGSLRDDRAGLDSGSAYLFRRMDNGTPQIDDDDWIQDTEFVAANTSSLDTFGSVSMSNGVLAIGAHRHTPELMGTITGAVHVFSVARGNLDGDGMAGLGDFERLSACLTEPCPTEVCDPCLYSGCCCELADLDADGDVDLVDLSTFQLSFDNP